MWSQGPCYGFFLGVSGLFLGAELIDKQLFCWDSSVETLTIHDADFDFRHVQPGRVLGGIVKLDAFQDARRLFLAESFDERPAKVRVQIIHHDMNTQGIGIMNVN